MGVFVKTGLFQKWRDLGKFETGGKSALIIERLARVAMSSENMEEQDFKREVGM